jgi:hypothetical protein
MGGSPATRKQRGSDGRIGEEQGRNVRFAGIRLAREKQVSVRVIPTIHAIEESVEVAHADWASMD